MSTKTIYVSAADLPLFERAAELGGGLSPAISAALRRYVQLQEVAMLGYEQIEVAVSDGQVRSHKRFTGRRLARVTAPDPDAGHVTRFNVYLTQRGQYAVHARTGPDWSTMTGEDTTLWENPATWSSDWYQGHSRLDVYPDADAMEARVPQPVIDAVRRALDTPNVEELDI